MPTAVTSTFSMTRHVLEQATSLEGPRDAALTKGGGGPTGGVFAAEQDAARCWALEAGEAVDQSGLSGAVRPDQPEHLVARYSQADIGNSGKALKAHDEVFG